MRNLLPVTLLLLLPFFSSGQKNSYSIKGMVKVISGENYPYQVVFTARGNTLSGYSITRQPDGTEIKAEVKGHINKEKHTLSITETKALGDLPENVTNCLFDAEVTWKQQPGNNTLSGILNGKDKDGNNCGTGTVVFEMTNAVASLFNPATPKKPEPQPVAKTDTPVKKELVLPDNEITAGVQKQIDWHTDTCAMEIWDGGVIDGDVVSVLFNDQVVLSHYSLVKARKQLKLPLTSRKNTIAIVAEEEGTNPPNTAQLSLWDGGLNYKITAYNSKGARAIIIIRKN